MDATLDRSDDWRRSAGNLAARRRGREGVGAAVMAAKRILVCLDGTAAAEAVLPLAASIARSTGQQPVLMSAVKDDVRTPEATKQRRWERAEYLIRSERWLRESGLPVAIALMWGDPVSEILRAATALDASLIAMTTRGESELARWALGSVADAVLCRSVRPLLLVKRSLRAPSPASPVRRILVPLDGTELAEAALAPAAALAGALGASVTLVRVVPDYACTTPGRWQTSADGASVRRQIEQAIAYLECKAAILPASVERECRALRGNPTVELIALGRSVAVDLVVIASHGRTGLSRAIHGSVAVDLLAGDLPSLIVPQGALASGLPPFGERAARLASMRSADRASTPGAEGIIPLKPIPPRQAS
ncbi:MAG TPA: universal stress protein [Dehalococcoidia bacterium]|jgi:nucleotide-binding universal stress UspA family protein